MRRRPSDRAEAGAVFGLATGDLRCGAGSRVDAAYAESTPPRVHALPVERATATVSDRQRCVEPEPDASAFGDHGAVGLIHPAAVDVPRRSRSAPVERDLACAKPGEVVVEVLVRRLDYVDE